MADRQLKVKFSVDGVSDALKAINQTADAYDAAMESTAEAAKLAAEARQKAADDAIKAAQVGSDGLKKIQAEYDQQVKRSSTARIEATNQEAKAAEDAAKRLQAAYRALGIKPTGKIEQERAKAISAYQQIKVSGSDEEIARALNALNRKLERLDKAATVGTGARPQNVTVKVDSAKKDGDCNPCESADKMIGAVQRMESTLNTTIKGLGSENQKLAKDLTKAINHVPVAMKGGLVENLFKGLGSIAFAPIKRVMGGAMQGIGEQLTKDLGVGLSKSLELSLSKSIGSMDLLGKTIGAKLSQKISSTLAADESSQDQGRLLSNSIKSFIGKDLVEVSAAERRGQRRQEV